MEYLDNYDIPIQIVDHQSDLNWSIPTDILSPNNDYGLNDPNENSIVIKLVHGDISFLLMGDSEEENNTHLLNDYNLDIDILKVSHHGAVNGTNQAFVDETTPSISILSSGNNSYGHPAISVTQMLLDAGSYVFSTADDYLTHTTGSNDVTADDDVVVETDGSCVWVNGDLIIDGVSSEDINLPEDDFNLTNYPNPFNPDTGFSFYLTQSGNIDLTIFNIKGQIVKQLISKNLSAGQHSISWYGDDNTGNQVPSGVYLGILSINGNTAALKKCLLMK